MLKGWRIQSNQFLASVDIAIYCLDRGNSYDFLVRNMDLIRFIKLCSYAL